MDADKTDLVEKVMSLCKEEEKPLIISLGGKSDIFVQNLVNKIDDYGIKAFMLHTVSIYPTPHGKSNIMYISHLKNTFESENIKIGYSGHEIGYAPTIMAVVQGAAMIERHFSLSRNWKIHHIACALVPDEYKEMNDVIDNIILEKECAATEFHQEELFFLRDLRYT